MNYIKEALNDSLVTLEKFLNNQLQIQNMSLAIEKMASCLKSGGKIISCGNGGSMCDSMHFAEELTGRFRKDRAALAALSISDPSHISCVANDFGYDQIFARGVEALGRKGDCLLAISTSGNSSNVINAIEKAKQIGMTTIALLGKDGGKILKQADVPILVPSNTTDRVQEVHIKIIHSFIEGIERNLFPENYLENRQ